ncbi:hypothetical protein CAEBREN_06941 [Caenorhabditis brenneri]|uniref:Uncharacterized protein n=1 Tax=Caenorhabditis brenneri TaxID=135651 RepID=G0N0P0_CAEBE|nr:hypothetical protein CAEBREN_06941 [Caenorhabditis brenneri]
MSVYFEDTKVVYEIDQRDALGTEGGSTPKMPAFPWHYYLKNAGSFFILLLIFSVSIATRNIVFIFSAVLVAIFPGNMTIFSFASYPSLYIDFFSDYFSIHMLFIMSLNRFLSFKSKPWNAKLFENGRFTILVLGSVIFSISSALITIITSHIVRGYLVVFGFTDFGSGSGYKEVVNRFHYLFQIGSIMCYIMLYQHIKKQKKPANTSFYINRGKKKVFRQLLVTVIMQLILTSFYELHVFLSKWKAIESLRYGDLRPVVLSFLDISNYLPEIALSLLILASHYRLKEKFIRVITPVPSITRVIPSNN